MAETEKHPHHEMLIIPDTKKDEAFAALKRANLLTTGQSTGSNCVEAGMGWHCTDRDTDLV
jgi:hypothetical protein